MGNISTKSNRIKKAFSLIELSIVILIIGILIAGVMQGGKLINAFRLRTAQSLTKSSPVAGITGLVAWYESTSAESFNSSVNEDSANNAIASWYDINPQSLTKNNGTQSTSDSRPLYKIESKTGLPMVYFDGSNDYIALPDGTIPPNDTSFTIFIATSPLYDGRISNRTLIQCEADENIDNMIIRINSNTNFKVPMYSPNGNYEISSSNVVKVSNMNILTASYSNGYSDTASTSRKVELYSNGTLRTSTSLTTARTTPTVHNTIGRRINNITTGDELYGYIGEIIIFSRSLRQDDRKAVEKYLGQKWGVVINN